MRDDGQALVEFALVLPLLLVFALAIVQIAEIGVARLALERAAAEAARTGALTNDDALINETVAAASAPLDSGRVRVSIEPPASEAPRDGDPRGSLLRVRLHYAVAVPLAFAGLPEVVVHGVATRRIEWTP